MANRRVTTPAARGDIGRRYPYVVRTDPSPVQHAAAALGGWRAWALPVGAVVLWMILAWLGWGGHRA
jgi:hypothetical protein